MQLSRLVLGSTLLACLVQNLGHCESVAAPSTPSRIKRVLSIKTIKTQYMENSDGSVYGLGENLYNHLVTVLQNSENFVLIVDGKNTTATSAMSDKPKPPVTLDPPSDRLHFDFAPLPAAEFGATVKGLGFKHGYKGVATWTGFRSDFNTEWNDGSFTAKNEFTPRSLDFARSWFGTSFDPIGSESINTISGVDAGNEGEFNLVVAGIRYKRDSFTATAEIESKLNFLSEQTQKKDSYQIEGHGFLFSVGATYKQISVDFGIKLNNARKIVFDLAIDKLSKEITDQLSKVPFRTRVEQAGEAGIIINAGRREGLIVGDHFTHIDYAGRSHIYRVVEVFQIGSLVATMDSSDTINVGDTFTLLDGTTTQSLAAAAVNPPPHKIYIDPPELLIPSKEEGHYLNLKTNMLLPYYLVRWGQYDQEIAAQAPKHDSVDPIALVQSQWNLMQIGLLDAWKLAKNKGDGVKVAIIDSGVDYNHRDLYGAFDRKKIGWDFFSWDARPFDDNSHGTAIAGIIAGQGGTKDGAIGIAPNAQLLAYKVFNPYGETNSAAIYGAVARALDDGAKIIVLAWDTGLRTRALEAVVQLVEQRGALLVTSAGDQGHDLHEMVRFPAGLRSQNLITVAALGKTGGISHAPSRFSNYGDGIVDIAAPGEAILSLAPRSEMMNRSGADLAAAHVAGVAALVLRANPNYSGAQLKEAILRGSVIDPSLGGMVTGARSLNAVGAIFP